jgi:hypothetical protein
MKFESRDSITRLPDDPRALEEFLKRLPPEVREGFVRNLVTQDGTSEPSELEKNLTEVISRLA